MPIYQLNTNQSINQLGANLCKVMIRFPKYDHSLAQQYKVCEHLLVTKKHVADPIQKDDLRHPPPPRRPLNPIIQYTCCCDPSGLDIGMTDQRLPHSSAYRARANTPSHECCIYRTKGDSLTGDSSSYTIPYKTVVWTTSKTQESSGFYNTDCIFSMSRRDYNNKEFYP